MGKKLIETGDEAYCRRNGYTVKTKGAGYIHTTGDDQLAFLSYINVSAEDNRTKQIAHKYPWKAACWEWGICEKGGHSLNKYVCDNGINLSIFLITQYYINGWPYKDGKKKREQFNSDMTALRKKQKNFRMKSKQYMWAI